MSYADIKSRLDRGQVVVLDGATGTELQRRGVAMDPSAWCGPTSLTNNNLLTEVHLDYINAGSDVITTNTFASSRLMLNAAGFGSKVYEINRAAVDAALLARDKAPLGRKIAVAGSLSHMVPVDYGTDKVDLERIPSNEEMADAFGELATILKSSGVDHIMLEMMYQPDRIKLALAAALSTGLPIWFGLSARCSTEGHILSFDRHQEIPLDEIIKLIPISSIDAAGVMHTSSEIVGSAVAKLRSYFSGPLYTYPDSGYFEMPDWKFVDVISPSRLEVLFGEWLAQGVQMIGGCCGLTVEHIECAVRSTQAIKN